MKSLMAKDVMVKSVVTIKKSALAKDMVAHILSGSFSGLPVVDESNKLVGMVTEFDILDATIQGKDLETTRVFEIMTKDVQTAGRDTPVMEIAKIMKEKNLIRFPIMDGEKLVGIVARCDILRGLMKPELVTH
jgi:CBS domain-containing protein